MRIVAVRTASETTALLRSIRRWLLALVSLIGVLLVAFSAVTVARLMVRSTQASASSVA